MDTPINGYSSTRTGTTTGTMAINGSRGTLAASPTETLVVIDHSAQDQLLMKRLLSHKGFRVQSFFNGDEALDTIKRTRPIAIFVDGSNSTLPEEQFLEKLRMTNPHIPIIVMGNPNDSMQIVAVLRKGATDFIGKPIEESAVSEALERAFNQDESVIKNALIIISERLRDARQRLGLKQSIVAARSKLSVAQVCQIENHQSSPSLISMMRLCRALRIPMAEVVEGL